MSNTLDFYVNGKVCSIQSTEVDPRMTVLDYLRNNLSYTGTKLGCGEGGCGACTIMISFCSEENVNNNNPDTISHISANACLTPLCSLDGMAVTTVEGIGGMQYGLHPVQRRLANLHGSQCGFCTPGIVMSIYSQLRSNPLSTPHEIEESLDGNLCRCTGYRPILDAAKSLSNSKKYHKQSCCSNKSNGECCQKPKIQSTSENLVSVPTLSEEINSSNFVEPIFPPQLLKFKPKSLTFSKFGVTWYQPVTMIELLVLKKAYPLAKLVVGNTEVGIETHFKALEYSVLINPTKILELKVMEQVIHESEEGIMIGATVTLNALRSYIKQIELNNQQRPHKIRGLQAIHAMLNWFASNQIRNVASLGGNIITASPISDMNPILMACQAKLFVRSLNNGERVIPMDAFFISYRRVDLHEDEILEKIFIPFLSTETSFVLPYKQARRREDDISIVTCGTRFVLSPCPSTTPPATDFHWIIDEAILAFGGMAPITKCAHLTVAKALKGQVWCKETIEQAYLELSTEFYLPDDVPGGQSEYRMSLTMSFLFKAFLHINDELNRMKESSTTSNLAVEASGKHHFISQEKPISRGEQNYSLRAHSEATHDSMGSIVGQPMAHKNAASQVCGDARYIDDIPLPANAVHACLVTSTKAYAKILSIDLSTAEKCDGFVKFLSHKDVVGSNHIGAVIKDEEIFAESIVQCYGAVIGVMICDTHQNALRAARAVRIEYEEVSPIIMSIDDAIQEKSFYPDHHEISHGDVESSKFQKDLIHVQGTGKICGQEHFYLENNCTVAVPMDNGGLEVHSSTQNLMKTQNFCASVCGLPAAKVVAKCKRMGGGFGGKETRSVFIACTAALSAFLLQRPVSINLERDVDMSITGQRHAFQVFYSAGCTKDGQLQYLDTQLYSNAGCSLDLSQPVMDRALFHCDNCYQWPAIRVRGSLCRTNQPSHTAFRGFGGPQGMMMCEMVIQHLAHALQCDPEVIRMKNFYQSNSLTHFRQELIAFHIPTMWEQIHQTASVSSRRVDIERFNQENRWKKRGICVLPTKFGISFTAKFMNQGGALVHIYTDGSVLISHGGTEMGQGLHTKVIQVAAQAFGIPDSKVIITETSTNVVANSSPTAASMSTDLYGMATLQACQQLLDRLAPIRQKLASTATWEEIVFAAYFERINLSAQGFFIVPTDRCGYDWNQPLPENRGTPFNYFTQGVACSEVEIDCLTGDSKILRTDILMDLGKSINPALDIGQIEGAFIQGFGWCTMEELIWGDANHKWVRPGQLFTRGPGTYKIPSFNDVPMDFRVHLTDTDNAFAVHSSKAVGEPPFFLGCSVFFAIKQAIQAAREANGLNGYYQLDMPATSERIRMACGDTIATRCITKGASKTNEEVNDFHPKGSW